MEGLRTNHCSVHNTWCLGGPNLVLKARRIPGHPLVISPCWKWKKLGSYAKPSAGWVYLVTSSGWRWANKIQHLDLFISGPPQEGTICFTLQSALPGNTPPGLQRSQFLSWFQIWSSWQARSNITLTVAIITVWGVDLIILERKIRMIMLLTSMVQMCSFQNPQWNLFPKAMLP